MDSTRYFKSLSLELRGLRDRVRHFIDNGHWPTDGEWKESVLRNLLRRNLPRTIDVGRGFVISKEGASKQIDVLIFDASKPVLFRDGDLVFITPDAVRGIIEVKSSLNNSTYRSCVKQLSERIEFVRSNRGYAFYGVFAYESSVSTEVALEVLKQEARGNSNYAIRMVCLGSDHLIHFWHVDPINAQFQIRRWHSYRLPELAFGYFLHNCVEYSDPQSMSEGKEVWFPPEGKEIYKERELEL